MPVSPPPAPPPATNPPPPKIGALEAALLALVVGDDIAAKVLAVWVAIAGPKVKDADLEVRCGELGVGSPLAVRQAIGRLRTARLVSPTGTTDIGLRWLASIAADHTRTRKR